PARLTCSVTSLMCWPRQQASNSFGDALSMNFEIAKSLTLTRSAEAPPAELAVAEVAWLAPNSKLSSSIQSLWLASRLSPGIPSIFRYASNAIMCHSLVCDVDELGPASSKTHSRDSSGPFPGTLPPGASMAPEGMACGRRPLP